MSYMQEKGEPESAGASFSALKLYLKQAWVKVGENEVLSQNGTWPLWVHRPLFNIHFDTLTLTDAPRLWPRPETSHYFPADSNSRGQSPYIPLVSSKYICLTLHVGLKK